MYVAPSGMPCLEASGNVIAFSPLKLPLRLISSSVTENLLSRGVVGVGASDV